MSNKGQDNQHWLKPSPENKEDTYWHQNFVKCWDAECFLQYNFYFLLMTSKRYRCVGLITLPPPRAESLKILEEATSWSPPSLSMPV
jgi:hypothetical protein